MVGAVHRGEGSPGVDVVCAHHGIVVDRRINPPIDSFCGRHARAADDILGDKHGSALPVSGGGNAVDRSRSIWPFVGNQVIGCPPVVLSLSHSHQDRIDLIGRQSLPRPNLIDHGDDVVGF